LLLALREGRGVKGGVEPTFGGDERPECDFSQGGSYFGGGVCFKRGGVEADATFYEEGVLGAGIEVGADALSADFSDVNVIDEY
jgi:hypothetical protein